MDQDAAAFLERLAVAGAPTFSAGTPDQGRAAIRDFLRRFGAEPVEVPEVRDVSHGRLYRRPDAHALVVFFHGGGWVVGDIEAYDPLCRLFARHACVDVLSVDYRLAPEYPFPAGFQDAFAALRWAAAELADGRPVAVAGDSAGGNLAAAVALRARDEGGPDLALQALLYPAVDHDLTTSSYAQFGEGHFLLRDDMAWFFGHYVPSAQERADPYVSPLRAADLSGVAPAYVVVAGHDPLRDEALAYVGRLRDAGVPVECRNEDGLIHGFMTMPRAIPSTAPVVHAVLADIGRSLR